MTILPYDKHFSRWQRAKLRAQTLVRGFTNWCAEGNATLPAWWNPLKAEKEYTEVLSEMEKVIKQERDGK